MRAAWALALAGCSMGPVDLTRIEDVRLIAAVAEPPEVAPGEPFALTAVVGVPDGVDADLLVWWCPPEELPTSLPTLPPGATDCQVHRPVLDGDRAEVDFAAFVPIPAWILACEAGVCGDLDAVPERDLRDPYGWLQTLPLEGVAAAAKGLTLTDAPPEERRTNPVIVEEPPPERLVDVAPGKLVRLPFVAPGAERASGLTDAGGFGRVSWDAASDGSVVLEWYAPEDPGEVRLWVVLDDELGGSTVWTATATVR